MQLTESIHLSWPKNGARQGKKSPLSEPHEYIAAKPAFTYVLVSIVWILLSDYMVQSIEAESFFARTLPLQTLKAVVFIGLSGAFIFSVIHRYQVSFHVRRIEQNQFWNTSVTPVLVVDQDALVIIDANDAALHFYGFSRREVVGLSAQSLQEERINPAMANDEFVHHLTRSGDRIRVLTSWKLAPWDGTTAYVLQILRESDESESAREKVLEAERQAWLNRENFLLASINRLEHETEALRFDLKHRDAVNDELIEVNEKLQQINKKYSKQASAEIREKDGQLADIIESLNEIVWCFDIRKGKCEYLSRCAAGIYDLPYDQLIEQKDFWANFVHPCDKAEWARHNEMLLREGKSEHTYRIISTNGTVRWLFERARLEYEDGGTPARLRRVCSDVTLIKTSEELIRQNRLDLESVFDNMLEQFIILDPEGRIMQFNRVADDQSYLFEGRLEKDKMFLSLLSPRRRMVFGKKLESVITRKEAIREEVQFRFATGELIWYSFSFTPVVGREGKLEQICFTGIDISEKKRIELELHIHKENLDALINNTSDFLWSLDTDGKIITLNQAFASFMRDETGLNLVAGNNFPKAGLFSERWSKAFYQAFKGIKGTISDQFNDHRGITRHYEAALNPIIEEAKVMGVACILRDVTMHKLSLRNVVETNRKYKLLSRATNDAVWELNVARNRIVWNKGIQTIFGLRGSDITTMDLWKEHVHPEDLARIDHELGVAYRAGAAQWASQFRFRCFDNAYKYILGRTYIHYVDGTPARLIGSMQDLTQLIKAERTIQASNERYRLASKATGDVIYDHDILQDVIDWSEGHQNTFGYPDLRERGGSWMTRVHPDDLGELSQSLQQLIHTGTSWKQEYRYRKRDGQYAYVLDRAYMVRDPDGNPLRLIGAMVDLTEKMSSIQEINKLSMVASKTNNMVLICDSSFSIEWVNDAFLRKLHKTIQEVLRKDMREFLLSCSANPFLLENFVKRLQTGSPAREELALQVNTNTGDLWVRADASPNRGLSGEIDQYVMIFSDISEQKVYESKIINIARELSTVIEHANAVIFGIDRNGYINEWNGVTAHVTGYSRNEALGKKLLDRILDVETRRKIILLFRQVLRGQAVSNIEFCFPAKTGKETMLLLNATPRRDLSGSIIGALVVGQDITELVEYRNSLERKVEERTEELNKAMKNEIEVAQMKKRFISVASHEFRTPLSTINFAAAYLRRYKHKISDAEAEQKLRTIEQQVKQMNFLLEDVLTLGKAESNKIKVAIGPVDLAVTVPGIVDEVRGAFGNTHEVHAKWNIPDRFVFNSDVNLLRHILINLLSNAIKFSPGHNSVALEIAVRNGKLCFSIEDKGIGIPEPDLKRVFEAFHRGENAGSIQGTGLGLNIVKHSVDLLKGEIMVTSRLGEGSIFNVAIPVAS